jgi:hypothetical protein
VANAGCAARSGQRAVGGVSILSFSSFFPLFSFLFFQEDSAEKRERQKKIWPVSFFSLTVFFFSRVFNPFHAVNGYRVGFGFSNGWSRGTRTASGADFS